MKNQEYSVLYKNYRSLVDEFNTIVERIVNDKIAMSHFWKYKKDYPADWKRAADNLTSDRHRTALLRVKIKDLKKKMRENTVNHPQK